MLEMLNIEDYSRGTRRLAYELMNEGKTVIYIVVDNMLISMIGLRDTLKEDSGSTIELMKGMGINV